MTKQIYSSLPIEIRKHVLANLSMQDMFVRLKGYEMNIYIRMLQAEEFSKSIMEGIEGLNLKINENILRDFRRFLKDEENIEGEKRSSLSVSSFKYQHINLKNLLYSIERGDIGRAEDYKEKLYNFLFRASSIGGISVDSIQTEGEYRDTVDFVEIVKAKNIINDEIKKSIDINYIKVLNNLILYYTQFWRILEMYGDIYADLDIILDEKYVRELYDRYLDNKICFQRDNPCIFVINGVREDFNDIKDSHKKQAIVLLYTILKNPLESFETIPGLYKINKTKFNIQAGDVGMKTFKYFYYSRLNTYLKDNLDSFVCRKNGRGFYIEKVC